MENFRDDSSLQTYAENARRNVYRGNSNDLYNMT
jgi:hypothetical protein